MSKTDERVNISFSLEGDEAALFNDYKSKEFIKNSAEAARKLMLESLHEWKSKRDEVRASRSTARTKAEKAA
jgi:hypothetical protein